jgi:hypothetical protein
VTAPPFTGGLQELSRANGGTNESNSRDRHSLACGGSHRRARHRVSGLRGTRDVATQNVAGITVKNAPAFKSEDALVAYIGTTPTSVVQDMETGEIISVTGNPVSTQASTRTTCQAGDAYWAAIRAPYTNACIYGSKGTVAVTPTRTNRFQTGAYHASGKWSYNNRTLSTIRQTPGSVTVIDNVATAISGTLY